MHSFGGEFWMVMSTSSIRIAKEDKYSWSSLQAATMEIVR